MLSNFSVVMQIFQLFFRFLEGRGAKNGFGQDLGCGVWSVFVRFYVFLPFFIVLNLQVYIIKCMLILMHKGGKNATPSA